jgi:hypothetical protein
VQYPLAGDSQHKKLCRFFSPPLPTHFGRLKHNNHGSTILSGLQCLYLRDLWTFPVRPLFQLTQHESLRLVRAKSCTLRRVFGLYVAWRWRHQSKSEFLASNRTQKGKSFACAKHKTSLQIPPSYTLRPDPLTVLPAIPLAFNFIASGECAVHALVAL